MDVATCGSKIRSLGGEVAMSVKTSLLTGTIYYTSGKKKIDITDDAISAVTIRMIEGFKSNQIIVSKLDNKKYELCLKEIKHESL